MAKKAAHHGGAWKVAYADFVTAMMALFMVLWISSQDKKILIATSHYFQHPFAYQTQGGGGLAPIKKDSTDATGTGNNGQDSASLGKPGAESNRQIELNFLNSVATDFKKLLNVDQDIQQRPIDVQVTSDGLKVTLFDRARQPLFEGDSTTFTKWGRYVMQSLAWIIDQRHFSVMIDGHTHAGVKTRADGTGPWELSTDQASAARRYLVLYGVDPAAIDRVAGYADTDPLPGEKPESPANQRLTISLSLAHRRPAPADVDTPGPANPPPTPEAQQSTP